MHHSSVSTEWTLISVSFAVGVQLLLDQHCSDKSKYHIHDMFLMRVRHHIRRLSICLNCDGTLTLILIIG